MPGFTNAEAQATLDVRFPTSGATDYIAYSVNGTSEWANLARTFVTATGWAPATSDDPSIKANGIVLTSAAVTTAGGTVTHYAIYSASSGGTQRIEWTALVVPKVVIVGDKVEWAVGTCAVTLT